MAKSERAEKAEASARKLRRTATSDDAGNPRNDTDTVEAHNELTRSEHNKGRPAPDDDKGTGKRPSNAGNDGP
jgi:hypothetical protein